MCIKLVNYQDKYTEMLHGQQNIKKKYALCVLDVPLTDMLLLAY